MLTVFYSPKGGTGTTVTAAAWALKAADEHGRSLLVDMCGDTHAAMGMAEVAAPGLNDWLGESQSASADELLALGTSAGPVLVVHPGARFVAGAPRWDSLVAAIAGWEFPVIIDAGTQFVPDELMRAATNTWMVVRPCYLTLRRATRMPRPTGVIVVREPGRALTVHDVEAVLGVPVVATIPFDPAVSRAVDAGLLPDRCHDVLARHVPAV
jgi:MinD-like ATPase involved in chromosome partitioning or flagellar assembly